MRSIVSVTTPATVTRLTTLARVKRELGITGNASNTLLGEKIDEASSDIAAHLGFTLAKETVSETLRPSYVGEEAHCLVLKRAPVASVSSVAVDGEAVDSDEYELDPDAGLLYRLDASGNPSSWSCTRSIVVAYAGGWVMPGTTGATRTLPEGLEAAAVELVTSFWTSRGRDPSVKEEEVTGVGRTVYWVGAVGEAGELPPSVVSKLKPYRRIFG